MAEGRVIVQSAFEKLFALSDSEDQCWVMRIKVEEDSVSCLDLIGGHVRPEAKWTEEMCCLPCRLRMIVKELKV